MYLPKHFEEQDPQRLRALVAEHPLGTWVAPTAAGLLANLVPFELDASRGPLGILIGHVAKANAVWREMAQDQPSLVIFQGPQAYISPNWYPSKHEHGKAVPTWNYAVVQARGTPRVVDTKEGVLAIVTRLTNRHEASQKLPWQVSDAPADFIDQMLSAIVGIEIPIDELTGKWKMHQHRPVADKMGVVAGLTGIGHSQGQGQHGALAVAGLVAQFLPKT